MKHDTQATEAQALIKIFTDNSEGLDVAFGVDPSSFMLEVEKHTDLPLFGVYETSDSVVTSYGVAIPIYELYVFYNCTFRDERRFTTEQQQQATMILRRIVDNLRSYSVGGVSGYSFFDGDAFGGVFCRMAVKADTYECNITQKESEV